MRDDAVVGRELTEVAASADPLPRRAEQLLAVLRRVVPFEGAWLALADRTSDGASATRMRGGRACAPSWS